MRFPCVHAVATTPAQQLGDFLAHSHSHISLPRKCGRVGLCNGLFEACSAFTHVTACTLAGSPKVIRYIEGFSYFVTSITAPIASGWSDNCRVGLSPTVKRRLIAAHANLQTLIYHYQTTGIERRADPLSCRENLDSFEYSLILLLTDMVLGGRYCPQIVTGSPKTQRITTR